MSSPRIPAELFRRMDESSDADFYVEPRLVTHIDDATIAALTALYGETLPPGEAIQLYFELAGGFAPAAFIDRSPPQGADPLWVMLASRLLE